MDGDEKVVQEKEDIEDKDDVALKENESSSVNHGLCRSSSLECLVEAP